MRTLMCQTNTTPNDFSGNTEQIINGIRHGLKEKVDLVVFPELAIPGYLCKDMMFRKGFVEQNLDCIERIQNVTAGSEITVVLGYIDRNYDGEGKTFRNMAAVIRNGRTIATYQKSLLPFYDVFDEGRYFQPGGDYHSSNRTVVEICGRKWGICICEDLWNDKGSDDYNYRFNPVEAYRVRGIYNIISINSSPFVRFKPWKRFQMVEKITGGIGTVIYCNQIGGQDELVFDGNSFVVDKGKTAVCAGMDNYQIYDDTVENNKCPGVVTEPYKMLKLGLQDYIRKTGFQSVVVGSSGGIDSAVVIALASDAIGPENVHGIRMPSTISSEHSKNDAEQLHRNLGCHDHMVTIAHTPFIGHILANVKMDQAPNPLADENIQARLRGMVLMYFSNAFGSLLLSTGNKTELALGYCTLYGDMNGGFCPISDLYKMQVYAMAEEFNMAKDGRKGLQIPQNIITKAPSAELAPGQTDEASFTLPYPIMDSIVEGYIEHFIADFDSWQTWQKEKCQGNCPPAFVHFDDRAKYDKMIRLINNNEFKRRQAAPGIKISPVAFGIGRRLPIVKG